MCTYQEEVIKNKAFHLNITQIIENYRVDDRPIARRLQLAATEKQIFNSNVISVFDTIARHFFKLSAISEKQLLLVSEIQKPSTPLPLLSKYCARISRCIRACGYFDSELAFTKKFAAPYFKII